MCNALLGISIDHAHILESYSSVRPIFTAAQIRNTPSATDLTGSRIAREREYI